GCRGFLSTGASRAAALSCSRTTESLRTSIFIGLRALNMTTQTNSPESQWLNTDGRQLFDCARAALDALKKTFETWTVIGRAAVRAREIADERGGRYTFQRLLDQQGPQRI